MKKKKLAKQLKEKKRLVRKLELQLSMPTEQTIKIRGQLVVIDYPDYPGEGQSMRFRQLIVDGMRDVARGVLPAAYAESCKQELIECIPIIENTIERCARRRQSA